MKILVTGGAGFIGSAVIRYLIKSTDHEVVNVDKLTYAGNLESLNSIAEDKRYAFEKVDICDNNALTKVFQKHRPGAVMHLAAESHVDRSIDGPADFIQTNIVGTYNMLEAARTYWSDLAEPDRQKFRFHHISTDEVYGSLGDTGLFTETTAYAPNSPYSASKASSDHLVRAWFHTFGFPVVTTNCSNNYGPFHFPEKLIPLVILNGLAEKTLPVYGKGDNVRDWLFVEDHAEALVAVLTKGNQGEVYNIGGNNEMTNLAVVESICDILDELRPPTSVKSRRELIKFVTDRPGHDQRYAIDASKIKQELNWEPRETFQTGLRKTVDWYLKNETWWQRIQDGTYQGERLGVIK